MFHRSAARANVVDLDDMERRMWALEKRLEGMRSAAGRTMSDAADKASAGASQVAGRIGDAVATALGEIGERWRGSGRPMIDEAGRFSARVGNDALRRLANEVEHRPLVMLGVAVGIGFLIGMQKGRSH